MFEALVERRRMMAKEFTALYLRNGMQNETSATTYAIRNTQYVLVLAYGNPLRRDDGVGWVIGERLAELLPEEAVDVRVLHQLTPELAEPISRASRAFWLASDCNTVLIERGSYPALRR